MNDDLAPDNPDVTDPNEPEIPEASNSELNVAGAGIVPDDAETDETPF